MDDYLQKIQERMKAIQEKRAAELAMVGEKREASRKAAEKAEMDLADAVDAMDEGGYVKASQAAQRASAALEMYSRHYEQLDKRELVTEAESDAVIDELLIFEAVQGKRFLSAIAGPLQQLDKLCAEYGATIKDAEATLEAWEKGIHPNFRSFNGALYTDTEGRRTNRSRKPVPVHAAKYEGCPEAYQIRTFLEKILPQIQTIFTEDE